MSNKNDMVILASKKDKKIFFAALINPPKRDKALVKAAKDYYLKFMYDK